MAADWVHGEARPVRRDAAALPLDDNLAVYDEVGQLMILLNTSAAAVWELCDGTRTVDELVRALAEAHGASDADAEVIGEDVRLTVHKLADLGLVVERRDVGVATRGAVVEDGACPSPTCRVTRARTRWRRPSGVTAPWSSTGWRPPGLLDRIESELRPYLDATPTGPDDFSGNRTRRTGSLIARSPSCRELVMHPLALGTARTFLGHATNIQLHLTQAIAIGPGESAQPIHRDQWAFDFFPFPPGYEVQCNTIWALNDFTEMNGATRIVPGSNHREDKLRFSLDDTEPAEMARGSVLFYSGSVYHGGGPNRSDSHPHRAEHHLQRGLAAPGGEPVPLRAARGRRDAADRPAPPDGVRPWCLRARLHRRPARSH